MINEIIFGEVSLTVACSVTHVVCTLRTALSWMGTENIIYGEIAEC